MPYFPSSSCEIESSSSLRHCVTTLRSLLRISWLMSGRPLRLIRRLVLQFLEPTRHEVIQCKADDPNRFDGLLPPRKANLLGEASRIVLRTVGSMYDVIATLHRLVKRFFDFVFNPTELPGDEAPRVVQSEQHARDVDAPLPAEVIEVEAANYLV